MTEFERQMELEFDMGGHIEWPLTTVICKWCGKTYEVENEARDNGYCSDDCEIDHQEDMLFNPAEGV